MPKVDLSPGQLDMEVTTGMDWSRTFTVSQSGAAINLTGATITAVIKTAADSSGTTLLALTGAVVSGSAGTFSAGASNASMALSAGSYWWSCYYTLSGVKTPLMWGEFVINDLVAP